MHVNFDGRPGCQKSIWEPAFTLVELLAVITVIAIVASLLLPALSRAKHRADAAVCQNNLRQIGIGLQSYLGDFERYPPQGYEYVLLASYVGEAYRTNREDITLQPDWVKGGKSVYQCPGFNRIPGFYSQWDRRSYGWNRFGVEDVLSDGAKAGFGMTGSFNPLTKVPPIPPKESQVQRPADMIVSGDALCFFIFPARGGAMRRVNEASGVSQAELFFFDLVAQRRGDSGAAFILVPLAVRGDGVYEKRHSERFNVLFCDGHVVNFRMDDLFTTNTDAALARWNIDNMPHREALGKTSGR